MRKIIWQLLISLTILLIACGYSDKVDRKQELDLNNPSIDFSSFDQVKNNVSGLWTGNKSILTADTSSGTYQLEIKFYTEESFRLEECKITNSKEGYKTSWTAALFIIDDAYVFRPDSGHIIHLNYLSNNQLKLNECLFERIEYIRK